MGKRKDPCLDDASSSSPPAAKKHKKHKKHKHRPHSPHSVGEDDSDVDVDILDDTPIEIEKPTIKLKLKIGGQTLGTKSIKKGPASGVPPESIAKKEWENSKEPVFSSKKSGDDTSDEEREWLDALEKGTLDESGALKKEKDPKLLTARQRSRLHGGADDSLLELPTGYKPAELSDEQLQRRQQRAKKRREQAREKREKDKKMTVERLLKKQDSKLKSAKAAKNSKRTHPPGYRYIDNINGISISVPQGGSALFEAQTNKLPKPAVLCGVESCSNIKKYNCSKTGIPLCSLECYKLNLSHSKNSGSLIDAQQRQSECV